MVPPAAGRPARPSIDTQSRARRRARACTARARARDAQPLGLKVAMAQQLLPLVLLPLMLLAGSVAYTGHELPPMGGYV